jgi:hydroxymethylpyrimidine kinase/phosphomethylpyrimidine kinase
MPVRTVPEMRAAAAVLGGLGPRVVAVTGGHLDGAPTDVIWERGTLTELSGERVRSAHTRGTGCTYSAAVAARLARGDAPLDAIRAAKAYVAAAIARAPDLGRGRGPLGH